MNYDKQEHRLRFAVWCAATAATSQNCRFKVKVGKELIEKSGLSDLSKGWIELPDVDKFDIWHKQQRNLLKKLAKTTKGVGGEFTDGVAAKIINIYLKTIFVIPVQTLSKSEQQKQNVIHPPIDRTLLNNLSGKDGIKVFQDWKKDFKKRYPGQDPLSWTLFNSEQYSEVIKIVQKVTGEKGMWSIEEYFKGYQE